MFIKNALNALASVQLEHLPVDPHLLQWIFSALEASARLMKGGQFCSKKVCILSQANYAISPGTLS